jgi:tetratricopeptide (TPR) repeat protein/protein involved in polysaccharide export with SLBB domain
MQNLAPAFALPPKKRPTSGCRATYSDRTSRLRAERGPWRPSPMIKIFLPRLVSSLVVVAALCAVAGATPLQGERRADVYYRDGARFALEGRLAEAVSAFEQVVALDPTNGNAYYCLGNVYSEMARWADAVNAYYKAISLNRDDVEAYNGLGVALSMRGLHAQSASAFEKAIKIYPKWGEPYYHLSEERRRLGQEDEARSAYDRAVRLEPDYATHPPRRFVETDAKTDAAPHGERAGSAETVAGSLPEKLFSASDQAGEARDTSAASAPATAAAANKIERPGSTDPKFYFDEGLRYERAGRYEQAAMNFRQSILMDRTNADGYRALGDTYAALGRWRESVDAYEQAARLKPDDPNIYQGLGRSYAKLREAANAPADAVGRADSKTTSNSAANAAADSINAVSPSARSKRVGGEADGANTRLNNADIGAVEAGTPARPERAKAATVRSVRVADEDADPTTVYRVGPGDVLDVRVFDGRQHTTTSFEVMPTGLLAYPPLAEPLEVAGLTTDQVATRLSAEMKRRPGTGADAQVAVGVRQYASHTVILSGMVKEAGTKVLQREGVPLYAVVAYAQPLAGAGEAVVESRATGRATTVDLSDAQAMKMLVRSGDVITVRARGERFFYIAGAVRQPGQKKFHVGLTLTQAVLVAGGASTPGVAVAIISRQADDGRLSSTRYYLRIIGAGRAPDPSVEAGDRIEVVR